MLGNSASARPGGRVTRDRPDGGTQAGFGGEPKMEGSFTVYLAAEGFLPDLLAELEAASPGCVLETRERLVLARGAALPAAWAQAVWLDPFFLPIDSIGDAARKLTAIQRNWRVHPVGHHRRAALIQEKLPHVSAKPLVFGETPPTARLGAWTLWEEHLALASPVITPPFPDGTIRFEENRVDPPNRAYLKLWELFTLLPVRPRPGDLCVELGSAPGGWTWVLANLGARVFSIDKAPLDPRVAALPGVHHCLGSGFALDPRHVGAADWFFSDMICYPERLYECVRRWMDHGLCRNYVCTLKFRGATDHATAARFAALGTLRHLSCNKHELTWVSLAADRKS